MAPMIDRAGADPTPADGPMRRAQDEDDGDPALSDAPARPGRPRALSPEVQAKLIEFIRSGLFLTTACRAAGITPSCFYHWRRKARQRHPDAVEFREFFHTVKRASAQAEREALARILSAAGDSWQAAAWFLERRFPGRWGRRRKIAIPLPKPSKRRA